MERRRRCLIHFYGSSSRINRSSLILRSSMPLITYFAIENLMEGRLYMRLRIMRISKATEINWKQMTPYLKWGFTAEKGNPTNNKRHMKRSLWIYDRAERLEFWVYTGNISTSVYFIEKTQAVVSYIINCYYKNSRRAMLRGLFFPSTRVKTADLVISNKQAFLSLILTRIIEL